MNKKLVKSIIPLCIFILFITTSLQKANDRYNDTAVVEAMVNDEEKNNFDGTCFDDGVKSVCGIGAILCCDG